MAMKGIAQLACLSVQSLKHALCTAYQPLRTVPAYKMLQASSFHSRPSLFTLDKDVKDRKAIIRTAFSEKQETSSTADDEIDLQGLTEAGITIPTLETHAMLIDGIPYNELPIVHIQSTPNNTIVTVTNYTGKEILGQSSCGREGFKNVKKSTNVAAQATGLSVGTKMTKKGLTSVRVLVKGLGSGRLPTIKGLQMGGLKIVSITDRTHVLHSGPRPRKAKRL